ncbi:MAG TPA: FlgD immunoglobulin-like domain containing protein [Dongiaceae bacterium]|nr:FlgD immunoglobulin-like domain containing protein [Dongiaceae bacterium]
MSKSLNVGGKPCILLAALVSLFCNPGVGICNFNHGCLWYSGAANDQIRQLAAERYEVGITGSNSSTDYEKPLIVSLNPAFRWFVYNSGTDNYVPPNTQSLAEYSLLNSICVARGWDPEIAYLHYRDDTRVVIEGDTLFIPGWGAGSAASPDQSRIPLYYKNLTRRATNFSTPQSAQLAREVMVKLALDVPFQGTTLYPDGIFLDNTGCVLYNFGNVLSGGHVREATNYPAIASTEFRSWFWTQNLAPFLTSLKDTLQTSASWSKDGKRKYLMINCANAWDDTYASRDVADYLFMEFQYNPVRCTGPTAIDEAYRRDALCSAAGISSFYSATMTSSVSGHPGSYTTDEVMLGNLCWFLMTRTPLTVFYQQGTNAPNTTQWDALTWIGAMDVADQDLGEATGAPYTIAQGTDPLGNAYVVKARQYTNGLVLLRNRGDWNQGVEPQTAVTVTLPGVLYPVASQGTTAAGVSSVSLRNGQGALFMNAPLAVDLLSFTASRSAEGAVLNWKISDATDHAGFNIAREDAAGNRIQLNEQLLIGDTDYAFVDPHPPSAATRYWLAELSRTGETTWYGPAILPAGSAQLPRLVLAQNVPNPVLSGGSTRIQFSTPQAGWVGLAIYDIAGREVAHPMNGVLPGGSHEIVWNGRDAKGKLLGAGMYYYRVMTPGASLTRKLVMGH